MASAKNKGPTALGALLSLLDLEQLEVNLFRGQSLPTGFTRVYGGQVLAQSVVAAQRTVSEPRLMHSMHAYFLLAGDPKIPIVFEVERVRDGASFTTRRVKAVQHGQAIFVMSVSFHKEETSFDHQVAMPDVPGPDELPNEQEQRKAMIDKLPEGFKSYFAREQPVTVRAVEVERYLDRKPAKPVQHVWMRANGQLPDDPRIHQCILTYASDFTLLDTALVAHGKLMFDTDIQLASLDHAIWLHRPFRADEWLLYAQDSPSATGARGFCRGNIFRQDGTLVASTAQEGLIRQRQTAFVVK